MAIAPARLTLLTFPQSWDGASLSVRFLCLPKGDPEQPLQAGLPSFATANLVFEAKLIASLDRLPLTTDATLIGPLALDDPPINKAALFAELTNHFTIVPRPPGPPVPQPKPVFQKVLTPDYRELIGNARRSAYLSDREEFQCALHEGASDQPPEPVVLSAAVTWGKLIAFALRQPNLATALGLMGQTTVTPEDPTFFERGGWLFLDLHATSAYAGIADFVARYAARIPPLTDGRPIFAAVLFPVDGGAGAFVADDVFREAEIYDDGVAKEVHGVQSEDRSDAIQLAWDDAQLAEWLNRQVTRTPAGELEIDAPNGVAGYRVDVRRAGDNLWNSLVRIESVGDLQLGPHSLGSFTGEGIVEVVPAQLSPKKTGAFWFPSYFATWRGSSLALMDANLVSVHARSELQNPSVPPYLLNREKAFVPVEDKTVGLFYGETYEFRVRLVDLSRGGADWTVALPEPPGNSMLTVAFKRRRQPGPVEILKRPTPAVRQVTIAKPRLGYPDVVFTGKATFEDVDADIDTIAADPAITREPGLPDPDVLTVSIAVDVKALDGDLTQYFRLYETTREFPEAELTIALEFQDHATLAAFSPDRPADGPLALPTAREIRLTFVAEGRDQAGYFYDERARHGVPVTLDVRADAQGEEELLIAPDGVTPVRSFFFQPPPDAGVAQPAERLAVEIGLDHNGLMLSGSAGRRTVLACSAGLRHTLSPERSAITIASAADLIQRWISVVQFKLARDWTWDGLDEAGIEVRRVIHRPGEPDSVELAGMIRLPHAIAAKAIAGLDLDMRAPIRQTADIIFFDGFDPKPREGQFPTELTVDYALQPKYRGAPPPEPIEESILLPVTTPPVQVPRIVSAGIALSPYVPGEDYSFTEPRRRKLWFEFAERPLDSEDAYFVRVLAVGPDPLLLDRATTVPESIEPPLAIDPEWVREISQEQPRDQNGLAAMDPLPATALAEPHYIVDLPKDLNEASPELFGFFVYEVRVGHTDSRWSSAQGRYGPALRIAGVQHPAPPLVCQTARGKFEILVRAPFATPVFQGRNIRPRVPATHMWSLLYARVRQLDAAAWRNVLVARTRLFPPQPGNDGQGIDARVLYGEGLFEIASIVETLRRLGLPPDAPLTTLAAEMFADPPENDPLGDRLGHGRILRISPLVPVPPAC